MAALSVWLHRSLGRVAILPGLALVALMQLVALHAHIQRDLYHLWIYGVGGLPFTLIRSP